MLKVDFLLVVSEGHKLPVCLRPLLDHLRFTVHSESSTPNQLRRQQNVELSLHFHSSCMFKLFKLEKFHLFSPMSRSLGCGGWNFITHGGTNKALDNTVTLHGVYASGQFSKCTSQLLKMEIRRIDCEQCVCLSLHGQIDGADCSEQGSSQQEKLGLRGQTVLVYVQIVLKIIGEFFLKWVKLNILIIALKFMNEFRIIASFRSQEMKKKMSNFLISFWKNWRNKIFGC